MLSNSLTLTCWHSSRQSGIPNFPRVLNGAPPVSAAPLFSFLTPIKHPHATRWRRRRSRQTHGHTGRQVAAQRGCHVATATITPCLFDLAAARCTQGGHVGCFWAAVLLRPSVDQFSNAKQPPSSLTLDPGGAWRTSRAVATGELEVGGRAAAVNLLQQLFYCPIRIPALCQAVIWLGLGHTGVL